MYAFTMESNAVERKKRQILWFETYTNANVAALN